MLIRSETTLKNEIIVHGREKLAPYKVPKIIEFIDEIPLTSVGKVNKKSYELGPGIL